MYCKNCGNILKENHKFCTECGHPYQGGVALNDISTQINLDQRWWLRLARVVYIFLYIPLIIAIIITWNVNKPYSYYSSYLENRVSYGSYWDSFGYSLFALVVGIVILRLLKIMFLYIALAKKPQWKKEFKRFF